MKTCPECGKPATVKFCSRRCAGQAGGRKMRKVTPELQHQILTRLGTANSSEQIARVTGVTARTVRRVTQQRRVQKFEKQELLTAPDVAMMLSVKERDVLRVAESTGVGQQVTGRTWGFTLDEVKLVHTVLRPDEQGYVPVVRLARQAGVSMKTMSRRMKSAGVTGERLGRLTLLHLKAEDVPKVM